MREQLDGGRVRGGILDSHLRWLRERDGEAALDALRAHVSPETARVLRGPILPISWYPFRALVEIDRAVVVVAGLPDERGAITELGRDSARRNLSGSFKSYARPNPHDFFAGVARMHRQYQDFGRAEYEHRGPTACRVSMLAYPCYSKVFCWSAAGYYEQAAALQGGRRGAVTESACVCEGDEACRFDVSWKAAE
jgi:hypothetical protein